jgi:hypothetical protein
VNGSHVLCQRVAAGEAAVALWQGAVEGLLACVASHVGAEGVAAGVRQTLSTAAFPFAAVFLLSLADVDGMDVVDEVVHVALLGLSAV